MSLGPIVSRPRLAENEVVRPENFPVWARPQGVHGPGLQVDEHRPRDELVARSLIVIDVDPLDLQFAVPPEKPVGIHTVLVGDDLPELCSDLVSALASLDMDDFPRHIRSNEPFGSERVD